MSSSLFTTSLSRLCSLAVRQSGSKERAFRILKAESRKKLKKPLLVALLLLKYCEEKNISKKYTPKMPTKKKMPTMAGATPPTYESTSRYLRYLFLMVVVVGDRFSSMYVTPGTKLGEYSSNYMLLVEIDLIDSIS